MDEQTKKMLDNLLGEKPIAYRPIFKAITGNTAAALFLSQAWYWSNTEVAISRDGWFYKTIDEYERETMLTRREQETAIKICKRNGFIETKIKKSFLEGSTYGHATRWFRVIKDKVYEHVAQHYSNVADGLTRQRPMYESANDRWLNPPNYLTENTNRESSSSTGETEPIFIFYKQEFGKVTPTIQGKLKTAKETYSEEWVLEALTEAVTYNKPSWAYAEAILKRWKQEGKTKTKGVHHANRQAKPSTTTAAKRPTEYTAEDLDLARRIIAKRPARPNV